MNDKSRRLLIGTVIPAVPLLAVLGAFAVWWDRLPDPVASHWGLGGAPNDSVGRAALAALMVGAVAATGIAAHVAARRARPGPTELSVPVGLATFLQWTFALITLGALSANLDAEWNRLRQRLRLGAPPKARILPLRRAWVYAAAAAVLIVVGTVLALLVQTTARPITVTTANAETTTVTLADGSTARLNSGSSLTYPPSFSEQERRVALQGEALFEVTLAMRRLW